jgi:hypothetical protein
MKNIILLIALIAMIQSNAQAQSAYNRNYKVCIVDNKYKVCHHNKAGVHYTKHALQNNKAVIASLRKKDTYVHAGYRHHQPVKVKSQSNVRLAYDDAADAYNGKSSLINDGVQKNKVRNINYQNAAVDLPPNDGSK